MLALLVSVKAGELSNEILQIQQKMEQLGKLEATPTNKQLADAYQQILAILQDEEGYLAKTASLNKHLKEHGALVQELKRSLEVLSAPQPEPAVAGKSLQEVERMQEASLTEKINLQNQLDETTNRLAQTQARLIPAQNELSEAKKSLEQANKDNKTPAVQVDGTLANVLLLKKRKATEARIAQVQSLDLELLSIPNHLESAALKKTVLSQKLKNIEQYQEKLQSHLQQLRKADSASIVDESLQLRKTTPEDPALEWLADENVALGNQLTAYSEATQAIEEQRLAVENQAKLIGQRYTLLQQQLALGGETSGIGELMRQTLVQLKSVGAEDTPKTIGDIQKAQIQSLVYERKINEIRDKSTFVPSVVERFPGSQLTVDNAPMRERLNALLDLRGNLLAKLLERNQQALKSWSLLLNAQNQFNDQILYFDRLLKENLLWTQTNAPMSPAWLMGFANMEWVGLAMLQTHLMDQFDDYGILLVGLFLIYGCVRYALNVYWLPRFQAWQKMANDNVGNLRDDAFRNTLFMLVGEFLVSLPTPVFLLGLRKIMLGSREAETWVRLFGEGLRLAAYVSLPLILLRQLAKPGGFLEGQLYWPVSVLKTIVLALRLKWLLIALGAYAFVAETQTNNLLNYEFGRLPFLVFCLLTALLVRTFFLAWRATRTDIPGSLWSFSESLYLLGGLFVLSQLGLMGMEVFGFHLGAVMLQGRVLRSLAWVFVIVLVHQILQRWLLLEQRRLAYARALAMHEEQQAASGQEGGEANLHGKRREFAEIQTISLQSQALLRLLSVTAFVLVIGWIWVDMIPAFHLLDQVVLWEAVSGAGGGGVEEVTLKALLLTLSVAGLIVLALRNLPGMLQLLVLPHLKLAPGSDFAVTTLFRYAILATGVVTMCRLLALRWDDLQWLVAALSVGLGFGLQEIFANFISGLIILFEKPIRIGDIVTLNNGVTGTIDAIKTRATMLTDWDNKEIIIPNKTLITEQLTNWSLSSQIIRIIIPVGISYGSDTEMACRLLFQAAEEHPQVLDKPEKGVFFRAFGASSLDFELRCFVANPGLRLGVVHDLNMRIDKLFREHGVEIAFPQMDLHIKGEAAASPQPARRGPAPSGPA